ncbi:alpha-mannosidase [Alkalihalobacillus sp. 1P02AB]|uniref:alpha-mannosidase n=1 Tax=Alkalihalobacillus sp. 1P02AB TaxID=3132260 RepID=UPI0039A44B6A
MFYRIEKLENRINELDRLRYRDIKMVNSFSTFEPMRGEENLLPEGYSDQKMSVNSNWSGRDRYLWLHTTLCIPEKWLGKKSVLFLDLGRTGGGNNSGFESLLYVNKKPFQGVDSNHREVILPQIESENIEIDIQLWSGLEGGGQPSEQHYLIKEAWYGWLDEKMDELYFKSKALLESIKIQNPHDSTRSKLLSILNRAFNKLDWSMPGNNAFYQTAYDALEVLHNGLNEIPKHSDVTVHTIGHSHIDLAWLWRTKHTKEKAKRTFSTVLRLMELYPDYVYLQSQPQIYEWVKDDDPELFAAIKKKVAEGQWEVEGAMWVEADCNIPSGESFVRQLLYGKKFFQKEFGKTNRTLWLPDVFGYSWSLPQILRKSGIDTFMTTKISWNQYNRMPHDTFQWRGIDGTEILTHFITTPEPGRPEDSWFYTYNGLITAETVNGIWEKYRDKDLNQDLLLAYGYGDGGGGVNREMLEMKRQFDLMPNMANVQSTNADAYFNLLHENVSATDDYVHTWDGELYLEYHRGTYTSQAKMKQMNRRLEWGYREAELSAVWNGILNEWTQYPSSLIEKGWKLILLNQFHDIIPGSSITEVYEDAHQDYEQADKIKDKILFKHQEESVESSDTDWTYFHPNQYETPTLVVVPPNDKKQADFYRLNGEVVKSQKLASGEDLVLVEKSRPFAYQSFEGVKDIKEQAKALSEVHLEMGSWITPHYAIKWNQDGQLTSIYDKAEKREMIKAGQQANVFKLYEDKPLAHDAWDIDLFYQEKSTTIHTLMGCKIVDNGQLRTTIQFNWKSEHVEVEQYIHCYLHTKRIDFETKVNWKARQQLLKVEFPVNIRSTEAIYDIQFGNVKRPTHWNTSWDMARFESVGHKWAALAETNYGISLMNDSKYGYSIKDHTLALSLLKGALHPDPLADLGVHHFVYSIYPFAGVASKHQVEKEAVYLNTKLMAYSGKVKKEYEPLFLSVSNDQVVIDTVKKSEERDSVIIRLHEMEGSQIEVALESSFEIDKWREVNLLEDEFYSAFAVEPLVLSFSPYEIKTIEMKLMK